MGVSFWWSVIRTLILIVAFADMIPSIRGEQGRRSQEKVSIAFIEKIKWGFGTSWSTFSFPNRRPVLLVHTLEYDLFFHNIEYADFQHTYSVLPNRLQKKPHHFTKIFTKFRKFIYKKKWHTRVQIKTWYDETTETKN